MRIPRHTAVTPTGQLLDSADKSGTGGSRSKQPQKHTKLLKNKRRSPAKLGPGSCSSSRSAKPEQRRRTPDFSLLEIHHLVSCHTWRWGHGFALLLIFSSFATFLMVCHVFPRCLDGSVHGSVPPTSVAQHPLLRSIGVKGSVFFFSRFFFNKEAETAAAVLSLSDSFKAIPV